MLINQSEVYGIKKLILSSLFTLFQNSKLVVVAVDDFHSISTSRVPTALKTSKAIHLATVLADIRSDAPAIPRPIDISKVV